MSKTLKTLKTAETGETPRKWRHWAAIAALLAGLMAAGPAQAAIGNLQIDPLAKVDFMPEKEFESKTQAVEAGPYGDEALSFSIRLPKGWTAEVPPPDVKIEENLSTKILGELARYVSPPRLERRSHFTVEAQAQNYEISARNWLINYLMHNGYTLTSMTEYSEREVEAMYVEIRGDTTLAVRTKAFINGPRVVIARYYVPQEDYEAERTMQAQAMASFTLPHRPEGGIEKWKTFGFLDQSFFEYPESWTLTAPQIKSIERMRALLYTGKVEGKPDGQINIYTTSRLLDIDLKEEIKRYRDSLIDIPGYALGNRIEVIKSPYTKDISFGAIEAYDLNPTPVTMIKYELVFAVLEGEDYYYFVSLLTPARSYDFYLWSRNMRAFRVVVETMRRFNTANDDYYKVLEEK